MVVAAEELLDQLAAFGGYIVSSGDCSEMEIAHARAEGRMYVNEQGLGFIRRPKQAAEPVFRITERANE